MRQRRPIPGRYPDRCYNIGIEGPSNKAAVVQEGFVQLSRAAALAGRDGVVVLDEDLPALDALTTSRARSHRVLGALERAGRLRRVRRGAYVLVDATGGVRTGILELVDALTPPRYLVSGGRALQFHDLTDQHFRRVHVLVAEQLRPWSWRGDEVRYVRSASRLRVGSSRRGKAPARIASSERAIADSLDHPSWGVTLAQAVEALDLAIGRSPEFVDRLAGEVAALQRAALARRLGFLVSYLAGPEAARVFLPLRGTSKASVLLLAGGPNDGPIDSLWSVRVNVEPSRLLEHRVVG